MVGVFIMSTEVEKVPQLFTVHSCAGIAIVLCILFSLTTQKTAMLI